jgi:hypothetical protein
VLYGVKKKKKTESDSDLRVNSGAPTKYMRIHLCNTRWRYTLEGTGTHVETLFMGIFHRSLVGVRTVFLVALLIVSLIFLF